MKRYFYYFFTFILILSSFVVKNVAADIKAEKPATTVLKTTVDKIISILASEEYKKIDMHDTLKKEIYDLVDNVFSWDDMGKRSLGRTWKEQKDSDKKEFISLFSKLLKKSYTEKLESYTGEKISYEPETLKGKYAEVRTYIIKETGEKIPVFYRMILRDGKWMVYDVVIEGISLVKNYRSQFENILRKSSFKELLEKLEKKLEKKIAEKDNN
ncbi:MAG: ABC transporter substrate-binding protein [Candidatus Aureabacteria bacterium]|nr:ABC transporter substrate-binding protein [Candidatus Auribacterota bacterium]